MSAIVFFCVDEGKSLFTTFAFLVGAVTSMFCGALGMQIATYSNYRTTITARNSLGSAFNTAYRAGCVIGFVLVSAAMLILLLLILLYKEILGLK
jgi:Na+/H+-translocating membrane pyrophosphatase